MENENENVSANHLNRSAERGFIFYDRLNNNPKNGKWLDSIHKSFNSAISFIDDLKNNNDIDSVISLLRSQAEAEKAKEREVLKTYYGITFAKDKVSNEDIIRAMNDAMNINEYWRYTLKKISQLSTKEDEYKGLDKKTETLVGRFATLAESAFEKEISTLFENAIKAIEDTKSAFLGEQGQIRVDLIEKYLLVYYKLNLGQAIDKSIDTTWNNLGTQIKNKPDSEDLEEWEEIKEAFQNNLSFQEQFKRQYKAYFLKDKTLEKFSKKIEIISKNYFKVKQKNVVRREGKKNEDRRRAHVNFIKNNLTFKKSKPRELGSLAEVIAASLNSPHKSSRTGANSTVFSTDIVTTLPAKGFIPSFNDLYKHIAKIISKDRKGPLTKKEAAEITKLYQEFANRKGATIVYESVKEYDLGYFFKTHGGFGGTGMTYTSAAQALAKFTNKDASHYTLYFNYLLNMMKGAIYKERSQKEEKDRMTGAFAQFVAAFLFDDYYAAFGTDNFESTPGAIHVFRLSGIVVPLSIFLEGFANAFKNMEELQNQKWFRVDFKIPKEILYDEEDDKKKDGEKRWVTQRNKAHEEFRLASTFFGDFIAEVQRWVKNGILSKK